MQSASFCKTLVECGRYTVGNISYLASMNVLITLIGIVLASSEMVRERAICCHLDLKTPVSVRIISRVLQRRFYGQGQSQRHNVRVRKTYTVW